MDQRKWTIAVRQTDGTPERAPTADLIEAMPRRLEATVVNVVPRAGDPTIALTMTVEMRALRPIVTAVTADRGLTAQILRILPPARLARYVAIGGLFAYGGKATREELRPRLVGAEPGFLGFGSEPKLTDAGFQFDIVDSAAARQVASAIFEDLAKRHTPDVSRARRVISDELLERVANVYREAMSARRPPKKAVQASEGVSEATAGRYIMRARERGFLGKTARGKKGERGR